MPPGTYYWGISTADGIDIVQELLDMIDTMDSVNSGDILVPDKDDNDNPTTRSAVYMFKVGSTPETVITVSPSENVAWYQEMDFVWTGSDDVSVKGYWYWQSYRTIKKWTTNTSGTLIAPSYNGTHTFYVQAEDNQGIVDPTPAESTFVVGYYVISPTALITSPSDGSTFDVDEQPIDFQGSGSDSDGTIVSYDWDFGDGSTSTARNPSHIYSSAKNYTVSLTVTDDDGATGTNLIAITVYETHSDGTTTSYSGEWNETDGDEGTFTMTFTQTETTFTGTYDVVKETNEGGSHSYTISGTRNGNSYDATDSRNRTFSFTIADNTLSGSYYDPNGGETGYLNSSSQSAEINATLNYWPNSTDKWWLSFHVLTENATSSASHKF